MATVIGFSGSALGTVGGVGGGGIFVPVLSLILGFDSKSAAALSKCKALPLSYFLYATLCLIVNYLSFFFLAVQRLLSFFFFFTAA